MRYRTILVPMLALALAAPVSAGIIFGKKPPKPPPEKRVPELLSIIKNDGDENKRAEAAEELRQYDPAQFPMIVPTLIDVLLSDKKPGVRTEAAQSLGKLGKAKPVSDQVKLALEYARDKDSSMRVRMQARSSLLGISFGGWSSSSPSKLKPEGPVPPTTKEPPLAPPIPPTVAISVPPPPPSLPAPPGQPFVVPPVISTEVPPLAPLGNNNPAGDVAPPRTPEPLPLPVAPPTPAAGADKGPELGMQY